MQVKTNTRRWLVAHDFSACADAAAFAAARDLAMSQEGGTLVLCHVVPAMPLPIDPDLKAAGAPLVALEKDASVDVTHRLERIAESLRRCISAIQLGHPDASDVEVEVVIRHGSPAEAILTEAEHCGAERITVGSHGRRGLVHMLLGSVSERVVRKARAPVLVVKEGLGVP